MSKRGKKGGVADHGADSCAGEGDSNVGWPGEFRATYSDAFNSLMEELDKYCQENFSRRCSGGCEEGNCKARFESMSGTIRYEHERHSNRIRAWLDGTVHYKCQCTP